MTPAQYAARARSDHSDHERQLRRRVGGHENAGVYAPRELAHEYRQRLIEGGYPRVQGICKAKIILRMAHGMGDADFTVRLDLPPKKKLV